MTASKWAALLGYHPRPWKRGEEHESMATIYDACNKRVTRLDGPFGIVARAYPGDLAQWIIDQVNSAEDLTG